MKLQYIYAILGALIGIVIAYCLTAFIFAFIGGILWPMIFKNNPWPSWAGSILITAVIVSFISTLSVSIYVGFQYGLRSAKEEESSVISQKVLSHLIIGLLVLIIAGGTFAYRWRMSSIFPGITEEQKSAEKISSALQTVTDIEINQIENGIEIVAWVNGPTKDKYQLSLDVMGKKFIQESVFQENQQIELGFKQQSFHFEVPFEELAKRYRDILPAYVLNFNDHLNIEELFIVQLKLTLLETQTKNAQEIQKLNIQPSENFTLLRLNFVCFQDQCKVTQKEEGGTKSNE